MSAEQGPRREREADHWHHEIDLADKKQGTQPLYREYKPTHASSANVCRAALPVAKKATAAESGAISSGQIQCQP